MALHGSVAAFAHPAAVATAAAAIKQSNALVTSVDVIAMPEDSDVTQAAAANLSGKPAVDAILTFSEKTEQLSAELSALSPFLKAGGVLQVFVPNVQAETKSALLMALMIGGFVDTADSVVEGSCVLHPAFTSAHCFSSTKPSFDTGSSAVLSLKKAPVAKPLPKWKIVADDEFADDDEEMIDEDTLLDDTDEVLLAAKQDCGTGPGGKKRACKNCTCGLKDEEDKPVVSDKDLQQMVSGCGNCFKGDAFRCGSCPFLGKPAFKPGMEKVLLNLDNSDDI